MSIANFSGTSTQDFIDTMLKGGFLTLPSICNIIK